jgi:ABC-2 type transport system permease protein
MSMPLVLDKLYAILRRDLLIAVRYRTGFALGTAATLVELAAFYYLSRAIGPDFRPEGMNYFPFLLVGTGVYTFLVMGIRAFLQAVQEAQQAGTLETLTTSATPSPTIVLLSATSRLLGSMFQLVLYLTFGWILFGSAYHVNWLAALIAFVLSLGIVVGLGMLAAALQIAIQKGSAVLWLFGSGAWFLTGTLFPISALPKPLRSLSGLIPLTHSLNALRPALLEGASFLSILPAIETLSFFAALVAPLGLVCFSYALRTARLNGTLAYY